jgi:hypothetical protein
MRPASFDGKTLFEARHGPSQPRRVASQDEQHNEAKKAAAPAVRRQLHPREHNGIGFGQVAAEKEHERREKPEHGHHIQQALENNGRKRARRAHASLPRQKVRANDLACPGRQDGARRKANSCGPKRRAERHGAQRLEQVLPPNRADREIHDHGDEGNGQPLGLGLHDLPNHAPQVDVVEKDHDQRGSHDDDNKGSGTRWHSGMSASTIPPHNMLLLSAP